MGAERAYKNERDANPCDSIPRVTWGHWQEENGRAILGLSLELNHRLLDGAHVGKFCDALCAWIAGFGCGWEEEKEQGMSRMSRSCLAF